LKASNGGGFSPILIFQPDKNKKYKNEDNNKQHKKKLQNHSRRFSGRRFTGMVNIWKR
jgi:hypothetical protein